MKHLGPALDVVVGVELVELVVVVEIVVTDEPDICTVTEVVWISGPLLPVTRSIYVPKLVPWPAEIVSVDVATEFGRGVTGPGRFNVTPFGAAPCHEVDNATSELKPSWESTVMIEFPVDPGLIEIRFGPAVTEKSGESAWLTVTEMVALWDRGPLVPKIGML